MALKDEAVSRSWHIKPFATVHQRRGPRRLGGFRPCGPLSVPCGSTEHLFGL